MPAPDSPNGADVVPSGTATPVGARDHARAQAGAAAEHMPTIPAFHYQVSPPAPGPLTWAERVAPGGYTHLVVAAGTTIRLTDLEGDACSHLLLYRSGAPWERLNVADTVKVQWQAYLGAGSLLLSDQGRVLASVISDTSGRHDTVCGTTSRLRNEHRYGAGGAASASPSGRELFVLAGAKHGLSRRDIPPSLSLFKGVRVDAENGSLHWIGGLGQPSSVELRAELSLLIVIANTAHALDPRPQWSCSTLEVVAYSGQPTPLGVWPANASPEAERAYLNNFEDRAARTGTVGW